MKSIELKNYSEGVIKSSTKDILSQIIDFSKSGSITTSDQRKRIKLLDILESANGDGKIELEDAEFNHLKDLVEGMVWSVSNKITRQFLKDFDGV